MPNDHSVSTEKAERTGWHFHPAMYRDEAWRDEGCPDPRTAISLPLTDERVVRAMTYPPAKGDDDA